MVKRAGRGRGARYALERQPHRLELEAETTPITTLRTSRYWEGGGGGSGSGDDDDEDDGDDSDGDNQKEKAADRRGKGDDDVWQCDAAATVSKK
jgi:hypothetical protein